MYNIIRTPLTVLYIVSFLFANGDLVKDKNENQAKSDLKAGYIDANNDVGYGHVTNDNTDFALRKRGGAGAGAGKDSGGTEGGKAEFFGRGGKERFVQKTDFDGVPIEKLVKDTGSNLALMIINPKYINEYNDSISLSSSTGPQTSTTENADSDTNNSNNNNSTSKNNGNSGGSIDVHITPIRPSVRNLGQPFSGIRINTNSGVYGDAVLPVLSYVSLASNSGCLENPNASKMGFNDQNGTMICTLPMNGDSYLTPAQKKTCYEAQDDNSEELGGDPIIAFTAARDDIVLVGITGNLIPQVPASSPSSSPSSSTPSSSSPPSSPPLSSSPSLSSSIACNDIFNSMRLNVRLGKYIGALSAYSNKTVGEIASTSALSGAKVDTASTPDIQALLDSIDQDIIDTRKNFTLAQNTQNTQDTQDTQNSSGNSLGRGGRGRGFGSEFGFGFSHVSLAIVACNFLFLVLI
ncbi:hypothetical protein AX774_g4107 [Zancudomyces culisetae]|uniref:Uncharacterized protein n=1 Tax=Zancudomyces culisetae TaxID=1213189 RepID=A0A1R1PNB6_ZANCU|nr:hypothetical protein AX774_g4107 [Zancudomyces culisetae]|eukprot:OMH82403.1 hypothetical protein AX774_g4107 [Zancudomyces culisetae]